MFEGDSGEPSVYLVESWKAFNRSTCFVLLEAQFLANRSTCFVLLEAHFLVNRSTCFVLREARNFGEQKHVF